jgi:hypothetical protein
MPRRLAWRALSVGAFLPAVERVEEEIGRKFPSAYKDVVARFNGASLEGGGAFRLASATTVREEIYDIGILHAFGSVEPGCETETMRWRLARRPEDLPPGLVSFSRDGAGNLLCFDYRAADSEPAVVLWRNSAQVQDGGGEVSFVAASFEELLDMLFDEEAGPI